MKLLIYLTRLSGGGAERTLINLANQWKRSQGELLLVIGNSSGPYNKFILPHVSLIELDIQRERYVLLPLMLAIRKFKPTILFSTLPGSVISLWLATRLSCSNATLILRESNYRSHHQEKSTWLEKLVRKAYRSSDHLIALSEGVKKDMIQRHGLTPEKITVIYNPVDIDQIKKLKQEKELLISNTKNHILNRFHLIAVGRLVPQKGFDLLIRTLKKLDPKRYHLTILGEGDASSDLIPLTEELGVQDQVTWGGFHENPYSTMREADLFVLSSRWEGFGHVIVEAMVCEIPVLAFDCQSGPNEIITHLENGILCEPESYENLAKWIEKLSIDSQLRKKLVTQGLNRIGDFDAKIIANQYWDTFNKVSR